MGYYLSQKLHKIQYFLVRECSRLIFLNVYLAYKTRRKFKNSILRFMVVKILEVHLFIRN